MKSIRQQAYERIHGNTPEPMQPPTDKKERHDAALTQCVRLRTSPSMIDLFFYPTVEQKAEALQGFLEAL